MRDSVIDRAISDLDVPVPVPVPVPDLVSLSLGSHHRT
jgi:hypothetical protein